MIKTLLDTVRYRPLIPVLALAAILAGLLVLAPTERTLGQSVKLVYIHGALVRVAVVLFAISLPVNGLALLWGNQTWFTWGKALTGVAVATWLVHTLASMVTTYAAWGVFIAWAEPRTRFTFTLAGVAVIVIAVVLLVDNSRFAALAFAILAGLVLGLMPRLGIIQHPLDPIGLSPSPAIRLFYLGILIAAGLIAAIATCWLEARLAGQVGPEYREGWPA